MHFQISGQILDFINLYDFKNLFNLVFFYKKKEVWLSIKLEFLPFEKKRDKKNVKIKQTRKRLQSRFKNKHINIIYLQNAE